MRPSYIDSLRRDKRTNHCRKITLEICSYLLSNSRTAYASTQGLIITIIIIDFVRVLFYNLNMFSG